MYPANDHNQSIQGERYSSRDKRPSRITLRKLQWPALFSLFAIAYAIGYLGFSKYSNNLGLDLSPFDRLYRTLQLAALESGAVSGLIPWELEFARWVLPLLTAYTAILTLATVFRQQFRLLRLRFLRSHVVICGLGAKGYQLAEIFSTLGEEVVVLEKKPDNPDLLVCKELGITTLIGDARETAYLIKARVDKAKHLIIVCGDDGTNLEVAIHARELNRDRRGTPLTCALHLVNPRLYTLLREEEFALDAYPNVRLEVFNLYERGAREMIRKYPVRSTPSTTSSGPTTVMIIGLGELGKSLLIKIARDWYEHHQPSRPELYFLLLDPHAERIAEGLQRRFPRLPNACDLQATDIDLCDETALENTIFQYAGDDRIPDIAYLCLDDHSLGFQTALQLRRLLHQKTLPIIVSIPEGSGLASILHQDAGTASSQRNIHPFDILKHTCTPELILRGSHELMARAIHEYYLQQRLGDGEEPGQRRALVPWESLPEDLRESNRRQVDLMRIKLDRAGYAIMPLVDWDAGSYSFSKAEIELMARIEHQHWISERGANGWTFAPGPADPINKTHPDLITWEELPERAREKDLQTVTSIPKILALAGYQIYKP
jgi:hypothetical protein